MTVAQLPELQGMVDAWDALLAERGWSINDCLLHVYGRDRAGKVRGSGSLYPLLRGCRRPGQVMMQTLKDRLGLDLTPWASAYGSGTKTNPGALPRTRAAAAVAAYQKAAMAEPDIVQMPTRPRERPAPDAWRPTPRLAVTINANGRGSLTFNLHDAPAGEVLRAFSVLQAAGLAHDPAPEREDAR
jgi:hypothetical protein